MIGKVGNFFSETKQELNKVTWPSRNELVQATVVTILSTGILALFIWTVDLAVSAIVQLLLG